MRTVPNRGSVSGSTMLMLFAAGAALLVIFAYSPKAAPAATPVTVIGSVGLLNDAGGEGLFHAGGLVPGRSVSRCITITYGGPAGGTVYFSAADITGPLAAHLRIRVEQGTGSTNAACTGFGAGSSIFDGMLPDLTDPDPAAPRTSTGWTPTASDSRTYRLTATVQDVADAQGRTSTATFRWFVFGVPSATDQPSVGDAVEPAPSAAVADPSPSAGAAASAVPAASAVAGDPAVSAEPAATVDRTANPAVVPAAPGTSAEDTAQQGRTTTEKKPIAKKLREALAKFGRDITRVAVRTSTHSALPVVGFAVLLAFLMLQNRIDPKLALAPMKDPYLVFHEPASGPVDEPALPDTAPHGEDA